MPTVNHKSKSEISAASNNDSTSQLKHSTSYKSSSIVTNSKDLSEADIKVRKYMNELIQTEQALTASYHKSENMLESSTN